MRTCLYTPFIACVTVIVSSVSAMPEIPEGMLPKDYYGGFYPTEEWVESLTLLPRDARSSPFQEVKIVGQPPTGKDAWQHPIQRLTREQLDELERDSAPYLALEPQQLLGLVPRRNRISGNSRVMRATRMPPCPSKDGGALLWTPDKPTEIRCSKGHRVDPFELYPPTGVFRITGPRGEVQEYPYHDAADGVRIYLHGEFTDPLRVHNLAQSAKKLGTLYLAKKDLDYARRAAAILYDFACAVPHWPKIHRGRPGVEGEKRFRSIDDYRVYTGIWYDKYHTGIRAGPNTLALAYDCIANAPVWKELDRLAPHGDARAIIERDLFLYTVKDAIRYDIRHPRTSSALSNYIPYQIDGMICIGRAVGIPEFVHYAYWKLQQLVQKTLMADSVFPESPSYARQHIYGMAQACRLAEGYSDPPGFSSTIDGRRFEDLNMLRDVPGLQRAIDTLETMVYPDDNYIMFHDTWSQLLSKGHPAPEKTETKLYPSFGHAVLGRGKKSLSNQIQAHLHYSGNWGHDHHDMLDFILWAYEDEWISDIGYAHTYRTFASWSLGHNLVVVDRKTQQRVPDHGSLIAWHPSEDSIQMVEASASEVYPQCQTYRRALFLIPVGGSDNLVLDIFQVDGGSTHEWMAQGSCMFEQEMKVSLPTEYFAESYADDGKPFTPPAYNEYVRQRIQEGRHPYRLSPDEPDPWYGVFRNVHRSEISGPFQCDFMSHDGEHPVVRLRILEPTDGELYTCTVPSLRRCWSQALRVEDHSLVEKFRMPKVILRRDGRDLKSRFTALWEPIRRSSFVRDVELLSPDNPNQVALGIQTGKGAEEQRVEVFYSAEPTRRESLGENVELQGRGAGVLHAPNGTEVTLYDTSFFRYRDLVVTIQERPALPLENVIERDGGCFDLCLNGTWTDLPDGQSRRFERPELVVVQVGRGQRVIPIQSIETDGNKTLLKCSRDPGFNYDPKDSVLKDTCSPFVTYRGRAEVSLPSRVWLRKKRGGSKEWHVRATDPVTIVR